MIKDYSTTMQTSPPCDATHFHKQGSGNWVIVVQQFYMVCWKYQYRHFIQKFHIYFRFNFLMCLHSWITNQSIKINKQNNQDHSLQTLENFSSLCLEKYGSMNKSIVTHPLYLLNPSWYMGR